MRSLLSFAAAAAAARSALAQGPTPGKVLPSYNQSWSMEKSTAIMICNSSGHVDPQFVANWTIVDLDWNSAKPIWAAAQPMDCEEDMLENVQAMKNANPSAITWVYRNGVKALPWFTSVRTKLEDPAYWGWFMPLAGCNPSPGVYTCGPNATTNLYHDFEQTPRGDCGAGVECGEYVFNHRNESLRSFLLGEYFFGPNGAANKTVQGFYVDDDWSSSGPSEMDADAVAKMGMSPADVQAMITAWSANQAAWREALVNAGLFEWFLFYGGQQTAPGWNQTSPQTTCLNYMRTNCGADAPSQSGAMFFGFSRVTHHQAWPLPHPVEDLAAFLITRGPYAWIGYGWTGCIDDQHPFTRPAELEVDYGVPLGYCAETVPGKSGVFTREWSKATVQLDCNSFVGNITMK